MASSTLQKTVTIMVSLVVLLGSLAIGQRPVRAEAQLGGAPEVKAAGNSPLEWNTFIGGTDQEGASSTVRDGAGNIYVAGFSPATWGLPIVGYIGGGGDGYVAKLDGNGNLLWNTFLGGTAFDKINMITVGGDGNLYAVGSSRATWGAPLNAYENGSYSDVFVAKLDPAGNLLWNTFLGVASSFETNVITVDGGGNIYAGGSGGGGGSTWGTPINPFTKETDVFLVKMDGSGTRVWNTFWGTEGRDWPSGIAVDGEGNTFLVGTSEFGLPVYANSPFGTEDAFVVKLNSSGAGVWNTFLGGTGLDKGTGVTLDSSGNIYVSGNTLSTDWTGALNPYKGGGDAFVAKLDGNGVKQWHTFLGGAGLDLAWGGIATDPAGQIYVAGFSDKAWGTPIKAYTGAQDGFLAYFNANGVLYGNTFLGGKGDDQARAIIAGDTDSIVVVGSSTARWGTPVRGYTRGYKDGFVAKYRRLIPPPALVAPMGQITDVTPDLIWNGVTEAQTYEVQILRGAKTVYDNTAVGHTIPVSECEAGVCTWSAAEHGQALSLGTYTWQVRSCENGSCGLWCSSRFSLTLAAPENLTPGEDDPTEMELPLNTPELKWEILLDNVTRSFKLRLEAQNYITGKWRIINTVSVPVTRCVAVGDGVHLSCSMVLSKPLATGYYRWAIAAVNGSAVSYSQVRYFWVPGIPWAPLADRMLPNKTLGEAVDDLTPDLLWNADKRVTSYTVEVYKAKTSLNPIYQSSLLSPDVDGDGLDCRTISTQCVLNGDAAFPTSLTVGAYNWRVQADRSGYGKSGWSTKVAFEVGLPAPALLDPLGGLYSHTKPVFQWSRVGQAEYYQLKVEKEVSGKWVKVWQTTLADNKCTTAGSTVCSLTIPKNLRVDLNYRWTVRSFYIVYGPWATKIPFTVTPPPPAPEIISPLNNGEIQPSSAYFVWKKVESADIYQLMIQKGSKAKYLNEKEILLAEKVCPGVANRGDGTCSVDLTGLHTTAKTHPVLSAGSGYRWAVRSGRKVDLAFSEWSTEGVFGLSSALRWNTFFSQGVNATAITDCRNGYVCALVQGDGTSLVGTNVVKLDDKGRVIWQVNLPAMAEQMVSDGDGNLFVAGTAFVGDWATPIRAYSGGKDVFVLKLDSNGNRLWVTFLGGNNGDEVGGITLGEDGKIVLVGESESSWGTPSELYSGGYDVFVAGLDGSGSLLWNTFIGGTGTDKGTGIALGGTGKIFVIGNSLSTWGLPLRAYSGGGDGFVAGLDMAGNQLWATFLGGGKEDITSALAVDRDGSVFVVGISWDGWENPLTTYAGGADGFLVKLDEEGAINWNTFVGGVGNDDINDILLSDFGNAYIVGNSTAAWGRPSRVFTSPRDDVHQDGYVAGLSNTGARLWNLFLGGPGYDNLNSMALNGEALLYVAGYSKDVCVANTSADCSYGPYAGEIISASWGMPVNPYTKDDPVLASVSIPGVSPNPYGVTTKPVLIGPMGAIANQKPDFNWHAVQGALSYQVLVKQGKTVIYDSLGLGQNIGSDMCFAGICKLSAEKHGLTLGQGTYNWSLRACFAGNQCEAWERTAFSITLLPFPPSNLSPAGAANTDLEIDQPLIFQWRDTQANNAKAYLLSIETRSPLNWKWKQIGKLSLVASQVCSQGAGNVLNCTYPFNTTLASGFYRWTLQVDNGKYKNSAGYRYFWVAGAPYPPMAKQMTPNGEVLENSKLKWDSSHGAAIYSVEVYRLKPAGAQVYQGEGLTPTAGDDALDCDSAIGYCQLSGDELTNIFKIYGVYAWRVRAEGEFYGLGAWSPLALLYNGAPGPDIIQPKGVQSESKPAFEWELDDSSVYELRVEYQRTKGTGESTWSLLMTKKVGRSRCDILSEYCSIIFNTPFSNRYRYRWAVRGLEAENRPWAGWQEFTVPPPPTKPDVISPKDNVIVGQDSLLVWEKSNYATGYRITITGKRQTMTHFVSETEAKCKSAGVLECSVALSEVPYEFFDKNKYTWYVQSYREFIFMYSPRGSLGSFTYTN